MVIAYKCIQEGGQNCPGIVITYKRAIRIVITYDTATKTVQRFYVLMN